MSTSIYHAILSTVGDSLQSLDLPGIADANIQVAKVLNERETVFPDLPGILVVPVGSENITASSGTNKRDDIGYPVAIVMLDQERQQSSTGLPTAAATGTQDQDYRYDGKLYWRETIRKKFINQRLNVNTYISNASIHTCTVEPGAVVNPNDWNDNLWVSTITFRFWSRETRG